MKGKILNINIETKGLWLGLIGVLLFSLTLPVTKIAVLSFSPYFIAFGRAALAGVLALAYLVLIKAKWPSPAQLRQLTAVALGVVFGFPLFSTIAMNIVPSSHGAVILGILPLATTIASVWRFKEKPSLGFWLVAIAGTALVLTYALLKSSGAFTLADGLLIAACACAALGYAEGGNLSTAMPPKQVISWALVISLPINLIAAYLEYLPSYQNATGLSWLCFAYLGVFSMYVGFFFWYQGLSLGGISRVSQVQLIQPFSTLVFSSLLLHEGLTLTNVVFAGLVVMTVVIGRKMPITRSD